MVKTTQVKTRYFVYFDKQGQETNKVEYILTDDLHSGYCFTTGTVSGDKIITSGQISSISNSRFFGIPESVVNAVFALCENCQYCPTSMDNFKVYQTGKITLGRDMGHIADNLTVIKDLYDKFLNE